MVGVPVLLVVWVGACWPFVWVMGVVVGVFWWCVFQYWVAVVSASSVVPGVLVCVVVPGACSGVVGWLVFAWVGVSWLVCVAWFRMLTCFGLFPCFCFLFLLVVWLITLPVVVWRGLVCLFGFESVGGAKVCGRGRGLCLLRCAWFGSGGGVLVGVWVIGLLSLVCLVCARGRVFVCGVCERVGVSGESCCLGCGCVVRGGVLPAWLRDVVASGGVGVGFDVGLRVFAFSGVSAPVSVSLLASSPSRSASGGSASGSSSGVAVCVPCAVRVFGVSWCSLVLRRWARAAGVDVGAVDALLGCSGSLSGSASGCAHGSAYSRSSSVATVVSSPASSRAGRVGVGFGARVRDWGACVGVGGGVVSGGGVVTGWWAGVVGRVRSGVSGAGVWGLVLAGVVGVVVLVSALVLVG